MKRKITQFGDPILRQRAGLVDESAIRAGEYDGLVAGMRELLTKRKLGIGLAANQVGEPYAIALIEIQRTPLRVEVEPLSLVLFNPRIQKTFGRKTHAWEGCISSGAGKAALFAKVPRYKKIELEYIDEKGAKQIGTFEGLAAQVIQHEVDHLNGVLFVDKVRDTRSYMTYSEYKKMKRKET